MSFLLAILLSSTAWGLLPQTERDLQALKDQLQYELDRGSQVQKSWLPMLVAPPQSLWEESKDDFGAKTMQTLASVFPNTGELIPCAECRQNRSWTDHDGRLVMENGEIGLTEIIRIKSIASYKEAKSMMTIKETPSGIYTLVVSTTDGRLLYSNYADSSQRLDDVQPRLHLAKEMERRRQGDSLSYLFMNIGMYPEGTFNVSWLEQWGARNQFISGLTLSLLAPTGAVGGTFVYMLPWDRKINVTTTGYVLLEGLGSRDGLKNSGSDLFVGQLMFQYAIGSSYGIFASADTKGTMTIGISLLNSVLFPFLL